MQVFFLFFCIFSRTIQNHVFSRVAHIFCFFSFLFLLYIIVTFFCKHSKKYFAVRILLILYRRKEKARHLLMSCSFFLVCHWEVFLVALQFVIIYKAGECSSEEEVYILIGVYRCKTVLGGNSRQQLNCNHNQSCHLT